MGKDMILIVYIPLYCLGLLKVWMLDIPWHSHCIGHALTC